MVCSNCHSKEVIAVQGEYYCINCGQAVSAPSNIIADNVPTPTSAAVDEASGLPAGIAIAALPGVELPEGVKPQLIKKRRPGRPKAGKLDVPATITVDTTPQRVNDEVASQPVIVASAPGIEPAPIQAPTIHKGSNRFMTDIAPKSSIPTAPSPTPAAEAIATSKVALKPVKVAKTLADKAPSGYGEKGGHESWREHFHWSYVLLAAIPALILALMAGGLVMVLIHGRSDVWHITVHNQIAVGGEALLIGALYYIGRSLGHGAIAFGAARRSDHRPSTISRWLGVAVNSFGRRLWFDLAVSIAQLLLIGVMGVFVLIGGSTWPVPAYAQMIAIFIAFSVLLYGLIGLGITQGFGRIALTLSAPSDKHAFVLGWNFFRRHFELVGMKVAGYLAELVIIVPLALAVIAANRYVPHSYIWATALATAIAVTIGGALIGASTAVWWQATYRQLVRREHISEAVNLLSGHQPERPRSEALISVTVLATMLVVAASVWPWLPWPSR